MEISAGCLPRTLLAASSRAWRGFRLTIKGYFILARRPNKFNQFLLLKHGLQSLWLPQAFGSSWSLTIHELMEGFDLLKWLSRLTTVIDPVIMPKCSSAFWIPSWYCWSLCAELLLDPAGSIAHCTDSQHPRAFLSSPSESPKAITWSIEKPNFSPTIRIPSNFELSDYNVRRSWNA